MSLCSSATKVYEHYIAVDIAISCKINGVHFRNEDETTEDKFIIIDGEGYFFSGDLTLVYKLQDAFTSQLDRSFEKLTELGEKLYNKFADEGDALAFSKYGFDENGLAYAQFTSSGLSFKPTQKYYGNDKNLFITYGSAMKEAMEYVDRRTVEITPDFFIPIYEAVANEGVGHSIIIYHLTPDKWGKTERIPIREPENIRRASFKKIKNHLTFVGEGQDAFPLTIYGQGDDQKDFEVDNPIHPELAGQNMSNKGFMSKPSGSFDMFYFSANYGRERSLRLKNDEVLITSENSLIRMESRSYSLEADGGGFTINLTNGVKFELTIDGDIIATAAGDVQFKATGAIKFEAESYEFE